MSLQNEVISIVVLTGLLSLAFVVLGAKVRKLNFLEAPRGAGAVAVIGVQTFDGIIKDNMGPKYGKLMSPYIGSAFFYILAANVMGLFGFDSPTSNYSVTLVLAFVSFILIQRASIQTDGWKAYFKGFFEPIFPFVIPNFFGTIAPLISLSLRLFGNVLSGGVIMTLLYMFTGWLSSFVPVIGQFNFFGVIIAPVLHLYFDLFSAFLQAFIFVSLTSILVAVSYGE